MEARSGGGGGDPEAGAGRGRGGELGTAARTTELFYESGKAPLTNEFLKGTWCTIGGDERSQIVFGADGSMKFCVHDSYYGPYGACHSEGTAQEWLTEWSRAAVVEQDRIVLEGKYRAQSEFKRGECKKYGL